MPSGNPPAKKTTGGIPARLGEGVLDELLRLPDLAATAQHIEMLNRKINRLQDARVDAWRQTLSVIGHMYSDGRLDDEDLYRLLYVMADSYGAGFTSLWDQSAPIEAKYVIGRARTREAQEIALERNKPNGPHGTWVGHLPLPYDPPAPVAIKGIAVVYVLYDIFGEPVYHGSTDNLRTRLRSHEKTKPEAVCWVASRCEDRERAYQVEVANLLQHLPRLNKKASR
jgi:predicted GIY-YIG superfamily endonuclease